MNRSYDDITSRIDAKPSFYQEGGVPRWGPFSPMTFTDVYAVEAVLAEIACQCCDMRFHVLMERRQHGTPMRDQIAKGGLHYGDPPNVGCCAAGPTMTSETMRVIEYWSRSDWEWTRDAQFENAFRRAGDPLTAEQLAQLRDLIASDIDADDRARLEARYAEETTRSAPEPSEPATYATDFHSEAGS